MRETLAKKLAMRWVIQPSRCTARMRQRNERDAIPHAQTTHRIFEGNFPPEPIDGETAEEKDHAGLEQRELSIEPGSAERDLRR